MQKSRILGAVALPLALTACSAILGIELPPLRGDDGPADGGSDVTVAPDTPAPTPCTDTAVNPLHCGACGHTCLGDPCRDGQCQPVALAVGQEQAFGIDVDDTQVFWSSRGARAVLAMDKRAPRSTPATLFQRPGPFVPGEVRVDGPALAFVNNSAGDNTASLYRVAKSGGTAATLGVGCVGDGSGGLAVDASYYYFTNAPNHGVYRAEKGTGECGPIATNQPNPGSVVVVGSSVFFTNGASATTTSGLARVDTSGGTVVALASGAIAAADAVGTDGQALFVSTSDGRIVRVGTDGSGVVELAKGMVGATAVAADDSGIYWAASGDVWAADKTLGQPRRIAAVQVDVGTVATDRDRVYWTTRDAVMRVAK